MEPEGVKWNPMRPKRNPSVWAQGGSSTAPVGPSEAQINSSRPQMKPNGAQTEPSGVQQESKWSSNGEANPYEVRSKINCAILLIAQRLHVHFDTLFGQKKAPKSALIPEKRVLNIVATKQLDVLRSITFYPRKTAFSIVKQHRRWVHCLPCQLKQIPSRDRYKTKGSKFVFGAFCARPWVPCRSHLA